MIFKDFLNIFLFTLLFINKASGQITSCPVGTAGPYDTSTSLENCDFTIAPLNLNNKITSSIAAQDRQYYSTDTVESDHFKVLVTKLDETTCGSTNLRLYGKYSCGGCLIPFPDALTSSTYSDKSDTSSTTTGELYFVMEVDDARSRCGCDEANSTRDESWIFLLDSTSTGICEFDIEVISFDPCNGNGVFSGGSCDCDANTAGNFCDLIVPLTSGSMITPRFLDGYDFYTFPYSNPSDISIYADKGTCSAMRIYANFDCGGCIPPYPDHLSSSSYWKSDTSAPYELIAEESEDRGGDCGCANTDSGRTENWYILVYSGSTTISDPNIGCFYNLTVDITDPCNSQGVYNPATTECNCNEGFAGDKCTDEIATILDATPTGLVTITDLQDYYEYSYDLTSDLEFHFTRRSSSCSNLIFSIFVDCGGCSDTIFVDEYDDVRVTSGDTSTLLVAASDERTTCGCSNDDDSRTETWYMSVTTTTSDCQYSIEVNSSHPCANNGELNTTTLECECDPGFGDTDCSKPIQPYTFGETVTGSVSIALGTSPIYYTFQYNGGSDMSFSLVALTSGCSVRTRILYYCDDSCLPYPTSSNFAFSQGDFEMSISDPRTDCGCDSLNTADIEFWTIEIYSGSSTNDCDFEFLVEGKDTCNFNGIYDPVLNTCNCSEGYGQVDCSVEIQNIQLPFSDSLTFTESTGKYFQYSFQWYYDSHIEFILDSACTSSVQLTGTVNCDDTCDRSYPVYQYSGDLAARSSPNDITTTGTGRRFEIDDSRGTSCGCNFENTDQKQIWTVQVYTRATDCTANFQILSENACSERGTYDFDNRKCKCDPGFSGEDCSYETQLFFPVVSPTPFVTDANDDVSIPSSYFRQIAVPGDDAVYFNFSQDLSKNEDLVIKIEWVGGSDDPGCERGYLETGYDCGECTGTYGDFYSRSPQTVGVVSGLGKTEQVIPLNWKDPTDGPYACGCDANLQSGLKIWNVKLNAPLRSTGTCNYRVAVTTAPNCPAGWIDDRYGGISAFSLPEGVQDEGFFNCSNFGTCNENYQCDCKEGFTGKFCSKFSGILTDQVLPNPEDVTEFFNLGGSFGDSGSIAGKYPLNVSTGWIGNYRLYTSATNNEVTMTFRFPGDDDQTFESDGLNKRFYIQSIETFHVFGKYGSPPEVNVTMDSGFVNHTILGYNSTDTVYLNITSGFEAKFIVSPDADFFTEVLDDYFYITVVPEGPPGSTLPNIVDFQISSTITDTLGILAIVAGVLLNIIFLIILLCCLKRRAERKAAEAAELAAGGAVEDPVEEPVEEVPAVVTMENTLGIPKAGVTALTNMLWRIKVLSLITVGAPKTKGFTIPLSIYEELDLEDDDELSLQNFTRLMAHWVSKMPGQKFVEKLVPPPAEEVPPVCMANLLDLLAQFAAQSSVSVTRSDLAKLKRFDEVWDMLIKKYEGCGPLNLQIKTCSIEEAIEGLETILETVEVPKGLKDITVVLKKLQGYIDNLEEEKICELILPEDDVTNIGLVFEIITHAQLTIAANNKIDQAKKVLKKLKEIIQEQEIEIDIGSIDFKVAKFEVDYSAFTDAAKLAAKMAKNAAKAASGVVGKLGIDIRDFDCGVTGFGVKILVSIFGFFAFIFDLIKICFNISMIWSFFDASLTMPTFETLSINFGILTPFEPILKFIREIFDTLNFVGRFTAWNCGGAVAVLGTFFLLIGTVVLWILIKRDLVLKATVWIADREGNSNSKPVQVFWAQVGNFASIAMLYIIQTVVLIFTGLVAANLFSLNKTCTPIGSLFTTFYTVILIIAILVFNFWMFGGGKAEEDAKHPIVQCFLGCAGQYGAIVGVAVLSFYRLASMTFGIWHQGAINSFAIIERGDYYGEDDEERHEKTLILTGKSRGLVWLAVPVVGIIFTKLAEIFNDPIVFLFQRREKELDALGNPVLDEFGNPVLAQARDPVTNLPLFDELGEPIPVTPEIIISAPLIFRISRFVYNIFILLFIFLFTFYPDPALAFFAFFFALLKQVQSTIESLAYGIGLPESIVAKGMEKGQEVAMDKVTGKLEDAVGDNNLEMEE